MRAADAASAIMLPGRCAPPASRRSRGLTLTELLVTIAVLSILAAITMPSLTLNDGQRLAVAADRVGNALRIARHDAMTSGQAVLVDAETAPGRLLLTRRGCSVVGGSAAAVTDPMTRSPFNADISAGPSSGGVTLTARFMVAGTPWAGLVFDPSGAAVQACSVASQIARGTPEAGSSIDLAFGGRTASVSIDPATGRISGLHP